MQWEQALQSKPPHYVTIPASGSYTGPWVPADPTSAIVAEVHTPESGTITLQGSNNGRTIAGSTGEAGTGIVTTDPLTGFSYYRVLFVNGATPVINPSILLMMYVSTGFDFATVTSPAAPGGGTGFRLNKTDPTDTHYLGFIHATGGVDKWATALDFQNDDYVLAFCATETLQGGTTTGDVVRVANTGEVRIGPGIGSPEGQNAGFKLYSDQDTIMHLTHMGVGDNPVALRADQNGQVSGIELWQMDGATRYGAIDLYGNNPILGFKLVGDPTATATKGLAIVDKALGVDRVFIGAIPGIANSDTVLLRAATGGKVPLTLQARAPQTAHLLDLRGDDNTILAFARNDGLFGVPILTDPTDTGPYVQLTSSLVTFRTRGAGASNFAFGNPGLGSGTPVGNVYIANVTTPAVGPTGGGALYAEGGALKWVGSSGTVTTLAPA